MDDLAHVFKRASTDLVAFLFIMLLEPEEWVNPAPYHYLISKYLLYSRKNIAIMAFRESGKTSLVSRAYPLYCLQYPTPDKRYQVFIRASQRQASRMLKEVSSIHQNHELLKANIVKVHKDTETAYEVTVLDVYGHPIDMCFEAYGRGAALRGLLWRGLRPQQIIMDDVQTSEDFLGETVPDKDWAWFMSDVKPLSKEGRIFIIGNALSKQSILERIIEHHEDLGFETMIIPAIKDNLPAWPAKFSLEELLQEKEAYKQAGNLNTWYRERMCQVLADEDQKFRKEWFKYYSPADLDDILRNAHVYMTLDPAISEKQEADYTAIVAVAVKPEGDWYVLDVSYGHYDVHTTIEELFKMAQRWRPITVGIEKVAYQAALRQVLEKEMPRRGTYLYVEDILSQRAKEIRIMGLQPLFAHGKIWFPGTAHWLNEMEDELLTFPRGRRDDLIDALAMVNEIAETPVDKRQSDLIEIPSVSAF